MGVYKLSGAGGLLTPRVNYTSMLAGNEAFVEGAYDLIETHILASAASSITFSSLATYASTYKHLQLRMAVRTNRTAGTDGLIIRLNGDSGANYSKHDINGNGSSVQAEGGFNAANQSAIFVNRVADNNSGTNIFSGSVVDFLDPFSTTKNKTVRIQTGLHTSVFLSVHLSSSAWYNTSSVTSMVLSPQVGTQLVAGTRISLYGIKG